MNAMVLLATSMANWLEQPLWLGIVEVVDALKGDSILRFWGEQINITVRSILKELSLLILICEENHKIPLLSAGLTC